MKTDSICIIIAVYLILMNILTFVVFGIDKISAIKKWNRVPEKTLLLLMRFGGFLGGKTAMKAFNHKTKKGLFKDLEKNIDMCLSNASLIMFYYFVQYCK